MSILNKIPIISQLKSKVHALVGDRDGALRAHEDFMNQFANLYDSKLFYSEVYNAPHYSSEKKPRKNNKTWMTSLDDSLPVTSVSMPGTHDSGARYGGNLLKCQAWTIDEQLKAGIRFLDIRCKLDEDKLRVFHFFVDCQISFEEVLVHCEKFLQENPTEFIIMRIRKEGATYKSKKTLDKLYREHCRHFNDLFFKGDASKAVTVKEARGKILVIKDFDGRGTGSEWMWNDNIIQDEFSPASMDAKCKFIVEHHDKAEPSEAKFHINFLSAAARGTNYPRKYAWRCNREVFGFNIKFAGIVVLDFPGEKVIQKCIEFNTLN